jgi:hypothetical protein
MEDDNPTSEGRDIVNPNQCDACEIVDAFEQSLVGLDVDERGLTRENDLQHLNAVAALSYAVIDVTTDAANPREMLTHRLAHIAQELLTTLFKGCDGDRIVREYLLARAELLELKENTRPERG